MSRSNHPRRAATHSGRTLLCAAVTCGAAALAVAPAAHAASPVSVFPSPGDRVATAESQIVIRGVPTSRFGTITVTGSKSGVHAGTVEADSDGDGGSFVPSTPFDAGERVTVQTGLDVVDGHDGSWSFTVQTRATPRHVRDLNPESNPQGAVWSYRTLPTLKPASVTVTRRTSGAAPGDLFFGPQLGPDQNGAEVLNGAGRLLYFHPVPRGRLAMDVDAQRYDGRPVLTWWQGLVTDGGTGRGVDEIYDSRYQHLATVHAGNGLQADLHEFRLGANDTAWITAYRPVIWNASKIKGGSAKEIVLDAIAQEIDVRTGLVLFQWDSLDHVALGASYSPVARRPGVPWDYFHINSIQPLSDGTVLISSRNTSAIYDVSQATGKIQWTIGGKFSSARLGRGARFWFQHDAQLQANGRLTLFDDAGAPFRESQSRGLTLDLDASRRTATVATQFTHSPPLRAPAEGSDQLLPNGDTLLGWGQAPDLATEYDARHHVVFDARFVGKNVSYRVFRRPWTGTPTGRPLVATHLYRGQVSVSASWNGTTVTDRWRILGGNSATRLSVIGDYRKRYFETTMQTHRRPRYVAVQAMSAAGRPLGTSRVVKAS
jgi:hypothetical protein